MEYEFKENYKAWIAAAIIVVTVATRIFGQIPNVSPITTVAMMSGIFLGGYWMWVVPFGSMILSDLIMAITNSYNLSVVEYLAHTPFVYLAFAAIVLVGVIIQRNDKLDFESKAYFGAISTPAIGSVLFFLITNFFVWLNPLPVFADMYPKTLEGLGMSYAMALPFFKNMLVGDAIFAVSAFSVLYLISLPIKRSIEYAKQR